MEIALPDGQEIVLDLRYESVLKLCSSCRQLGHYQISCPKIHSSSSKGKEIVIRDQATSSNQIFRKTNPDNQVEAKKTGSLKESEQYSVASLMNPVIHGATVQIPGGRLRQTKHIRNTNSAAICQKTCADHQTAETPDPNFQNQASLLPAKGTSTNTHKSTDTSLEAPNLIFRDCSTVTKTVSETASDLQKPFLPATVSDMVQSGGVQGVKTMGQERMDKNNDLHTIQEVAPARRTVPDQTVKPVKLTGNTVSGFQNLSFQPDTISAILSDTVQNAGLKGFKGKGPEHDGTQQLVSQSCRAGMASKQVSDIDQPLDRIQESGTLILANQSTEPQALIPNTNEPEGNSTNAQKITDTSLVTQISIFRHCSKVLATVSETLSDFQNLVSQSCMPSLVANIVQTEGAKDFTGKGQELQGKHHILATTKETESARRIVFEQSGNTSGKPVSDLQQAGFQADKMPDTMQKEGSKVSKGLEPYSTKHRDLNLPNLGKQHEVETQQNAQDTSPWKIQTRARTQRKRAAAAELPKPELNPNTSKQNKEEEAGTLEEGEICSEIDQDMEAPHQTGGYPTFPPIIVCLPADEWLKEDTQAFDQCSPRKCHKSQEPLNKTESSTGADLNGQPRKHERKGKSWRLPANPT